MGKGHPRAPGSGGGVVTAPVPVRVSSLSQFASADGRHGIAVEARVDFFGDRYVVLGVAERTPDGWVSGVRTGIVRRRFARASHDGAVAAVAAILRARQARWAGVTGQSPVWWTEAATEAARAAWDAQVTS